MQYRKFGKTNLQVSAIGLGTEHLNKKSRKTVVLVTQKAIGSGVNYFDIIFSFAEYRNNFGAALKGHRQEVIIAGHIGCAETNGRYRLSRNVKENKKLFLDLLRRLHTDYIDIYMIQMVNAYESYDRVMKRGGLMELGERFKKEGKVRYIGISGHNPPGVMRFIKGSHIDVLMFPINLAWDLNPGRKAVLDACYREDIGVVGMKIYGGGRLFHNKNSVQIDPVKCIAYVLAQPGVATTVPGVKNAKQLDGALRYFKSSAKEHNFNTVIKGFQEELEGNCLYCNHCLPCPAEIDIAKVILMVDRKSCEASEHPAENYIALKERRNFYSPGRIRPSSSRFKNLSLKASECTECGACMERCPFNVDIISKMKQAVELLG